MYFWEGEDDFVKDNGIDVVFTGHQHSYSRSKQLLTDDDTKYKNITSSYSIKRNFFSFCHKLEIILSTVKLLTHYMCFAKIFAV